MRYDIFLTRALQIELGIVNNADNFALQHNRFFEHFQGNLKEVPVIIICDCSRCLMV